MKRILMPLLFSARAAAPPLAGPYDQPYSDHRERHGPFGRPERDPASSSTASTTAMRSRRKRAVVPPGTHQVTVDVPPRKGFHTATQHTFELVTEPCMRYYISAKLDNRVGQQWEPMVRSKDRIGECEKKFAIKPMTRAAARGAPPARRVQRAARHAGRGRRRELRDRARRGAGRGGRVRSREVDHRHRDHRVAGAAGPHRGRRNPARGPAHRPAARRGDAPHPWAAHRRDLPGPAHVAEPALHRGPSARGDHPHALAARRGRGARARDRAAGRGRHPRARAARRTTTRTSSPAACASAW